MLSFCTKITISFTHNFASVHTIAPPQLSVKVLCIQEIWSSMLRMTGVLVTELLKASGVTLYQHYYHMPVWYNTIQSIVTTKVFIAVVWNTMNKEKRFVLTSVKELSVLLIRFEPCWDLVKEVKRSSVTHQRVTQAKPFKDKSSLANAAEQGVLYLHLHVSVQAVLSQASTGDFQDWGKVVVRLFDSQVLEEYQFQTHYLLSSSKDVITFL